MNYANYRDHWVVERRHMLLSYHLSLVAVLI